MLLSGARVPEASNPGEVTQSSLAPASASRRRNRLSGVGVGGDRSCPLPQSEVHGFRWIQATYWYEYVAAVPGQPDQVLIWVPGQDRKA